MKLAKTCLQLDVGNSSAKWRLMVAGESIVRGRYTEDDAGSQAALLACSSAVEQIWISSVASADRNTRLARLLESHWGVSPWIPQSAAQTGVLCNSYAQPERMGVDRWLAMLGAQRHRHGRFAVVDAGSALTIDIVANNGQHEGGYIIPGAELMERALLLDTDRVRFEQDVAYALDPGRSTAEAVRHGIAVAQVGSVHHVLEKAGIAATQMLFCGGGAEVLMQLMGIEGGYSPDLVFEGLEIMALEAD
ncbi:MAG: type III pantothenate kinase [Halioglobus sp.]